MAGKRPGRITRIGGLRGNPRNAPHHISVYLNDVDNEYVVGMSKVMGVGKAEFIRMAVGVMRTTPASAFPTTDVTLPDPGSTTQQGETDGAS